MSRGLGDVYKRQGELGTQALMKYYTMAQETDFNDDEDAGDNL